MRSTIVTFFLLVTLFCAIPATAAEILVYVYPCLVVRGQDSWIAWDSIGTMADRVNITVWRGETKVAEFLDIENKLYPAERNMYLWPVPESLTNGIYNFCITTVDNLVSGQGRAPVHEKGMVIPTLYIDRELVRGEYLPITWHGYGLGLSPRVKLDLYQNNVLVGRIGESDMSHSSGCGRTFHWKIGHLWDPGAFAPSMSLIVPPGHGYKIRVQRFDGAYFDETGTFSIAPALIPIPFDKFMKRIKELAVLPVPPQPDPCPTCGELQLGELPRALQPYTGALEVALYANGREVARLLGAGSHGRFEARQRVNFGRDFALVKNGVKGFELRFFNPAGKLLYCQPVKLKLQKR